VEILFDEYVFCTYQSRHNVHSRNIVELNNRPVAIDDKAITYANTPVNINILRNDKDSDGDKLSIKARLVLTLRRSPSLLNLINFSGNVKKSSSLINHTLTDRMSEIVFNCS
jgi:Bacterial cadherin-like domain